MRDFIKEAKEILLCFGINLPEDQPWVLEPGYPEKDQFYLHLFEHGRGIAMDWKGDPISLFLSQLEKQTSRYGLKVDLSGLLEKHRNTHEFKRWLPDVEKYLLERGFILLNLDGLDDDMVFDILPLTEADNLRNNALFQKFLRMTKSLL